jgi:hypothetical protein
MKNISMNNLYINNYNIEKIQSDAYVCGGAFIPYLSSLKINYPNLYDTPLRCSLTFFNT